MQREFVCCLFRCLHVFEALYFRPCQHKSVFVGKRIHVGAFGPSYHIYELRVLIEKASRVLKTLLKVSQNENACTF